MQDEWDTNRRHRIALESNDVREKCGNMARTADRICCETVALLVRRSVIPAYHDSGPFIEPSIGRSLIPKGMRQLAHYAALDGPLYQSRSDWRFVYELVRSFIAKERGKIASTIRL